MTFVKAMTFYDIAGKFYFIVSAKILRVWEGIGEVHFILEWLRLPKLNVHNGSYSYTNYIVKHLRTSL